MDRSWTGRKHVPYRSHTVCGQFLERSLINFEQKEREKREWGGREGGSRGGRWEVE